MGLLPTVKSVIDASGIIRLDVDSIADLDAMDFVLSTYRALVADHFRTLTLYEYNLYY